jgi:hypothetical protein
MAVGRRAWYGRVWRVVNVAMVASRPRAEAVGGGVDHMCLHCCTFLGEDPKGNPHPACRTRSGPFVMELSQELRSWRAWLGTALLLLLAGLAAVSKRQRGR